MAEPLKVTVTVHDPETDETTTAEVPPGKYLLLCVEPCHRVGVEGHANGTHVITVGGVRRPMAGLTVPDELAPGRTS
jgi:hypothetical protein